MEQRLIDEQVKAARIARDRALQAEQARQTRLLQMAEDHHKAEQIRGLVTAVVRLRGPDAAEAESHMKWAAWAGAVADRLDPTLRLSFDADGLARLAEAVAPDPDP